MSRTTARRSTTAAAALGASALAGLSFAAAPASANTEVERPDEFTSAFTVMATPDTIINPDGESVPGEEGAWGTFDFMVNSDEEIICYDITFEGVTPPYESPALTATHIHEAVAGEQGPPRIAFPDPTGEGDVLTSQGCMQGPFTTGIEDDDGNDTGDGFSLAQLEADAAGFQADTHTSQFVAGAIRGQLQQVPVDGLPTGFGGAATSSESGTGTAVLIAAGGLTLAGAAAAGVTVARRRG